MADDSPWTLSDATDTRASITNGTSTVDVFSFGPVQRASDVHTVLAASERSDVFVLHVDGLYAVPADAPVESFTSMTALESVIRDRVVLERFFMDAHDAAGVHPAPDAVRAALTQTLGRLVNPPPAFPASFGLVDLGCGRPDRVEDYASAHPDEYVLGVDFKPPLYAASPNVSYWRLSANDALRKLIDTQTAVQAINADFLFGNLETGSPEELLDNVTELLPSGGQFTASSLKAIAYAMGEQLAQSGFHVGVLETQDGFDEIRHTQTGAKIVDKFLTTGLSPDSDQTPTRLIATKN